jgi:DNA-binding response OmpR family regulator
MIAQDISPVRVHDLHWSHKQSAIIVRHRIVALTKTEYRVLFPLRHGVPVTYEDLASTVYNSTVDKKVRVALDKHVDRIRSKLNSTGMYLYCVQDYGYVLLPRKES